MASREWTRGGFSFRGIHSSEFGVFETPDSLQLMPHKRRNLIQIPGRSKAFIQEDGGYDENRISLSCSYVPSYGEDLQRRVREIARWLSGVGELSMDYEEEMHYQAFLSSPPPLTKDLSYDAAEFTLDFTITHPFAYELPQHKTSVVGRNQFFLVEVGGTITTPARFRIINTGANTIKNLTLVLRNEEY